MLVQIEIHILACIMQNAETPHGADKPAEEGSIEGEKNEYSQEERTEKERKKEGKEKKEREEKADRGRDKQIAKRLVESPDLEEAVEKLKNDVADLQNFFDGSLHKKRGKQKENRLVTIAETQEVINTLNNKITEVRENDNLQFKAVDLWATVNGLQANPDEIEIGFPSPGDELLLDYFYKIRRGDKSLMAGGQSSCLRIDADGFSIIETHKGNQKNALRKFDSVVFNRSMKDQTSQHMFTLGMGMGEEKEFWTGEFVEHVKRYGFLVYVHDKESRKNYKLSIDLYPQNKERQKNGRYLHIAMEPTSDGKGKIETKLNNADPRKGSELR